MRAPWHVKLAKIFFSDLSLDRSTSKFHILYTVMVLINFKIFEQFGQG